LKRPYATVIALVDEKGAVTAAWVDVSSGNADYDKAAVAAMKQWTFMPAAANCQSLPGESEWVVGGSDTTFADPCDHEARVTLPANPAAPDLALTSGVPIETAVTVSLDQFGEVMRVKLQRASGSPAFDDAAQKAALASNFFPAVKACMPVAGDYVVLPRPGEPGRGTHQPPPRKHLRQL